MNLLTLVVVPVVNSLKVEYTSIVVILAREDNGVEVSGVRVGDGVTVGVPSTET